LPPNCISSYLPTPTTCQPTFLPPIFMLHFFMFFTLWFLRLRFFQHFFHVTKLSKLNFNLLEGVRNSKLLYFYYFGRGAWSSLLFIHLYFGCLQVGCPSSKLLFFIIIATCILKARSLFFKLQAPHNYFFFCYYL